VICTRTPFRRGQARAEGIFRTRPRVGEKVGKCSRAKRLGPMFRKEKTSVHRGKTGKTERGGGTLENAYHGGRDVKGQFTGIAPRKDAQRRPYCRMGGVGGLTSQKKS